MEDRKDTADIATLEPWMLEVLRELGEQADRIKAGVACRECQGAGKLAVCSRLGVQWHACGPCDGTGSRVRIY